MLKLIPPGERSPFFRIRGTYLGLHVDRSTRSENKTVARRQLEMTKDAIERQRFERRDPPHPFFEHAPPVQ